jgi:hypothetical protein
VLHHDHDLGDDQRADDRDRQATKLDLLHGEHQPLEEDHHSEAGGKIERDQPNGLDLARHPLPDAHACALLSHHPVSLASPSQVLGRRLGTQPDREDRVREPLPLEDAHLLVR